MDWMGLIHSRVSLVAQMVNKVKLLSHVWLFATPPGSSIRGIFRARVLERVAISFSRGSSWPRNQTQVSHIAGRHFTVWARREAPTMQEMWVQSLNQEDSPREGNGNPLQYSCWKIPWTEEPAGLQSMGSQRVGHDWATSTFIHNREGNLLYLAYWLKW